ncbi:MAG: FCD domain-containing protein [Microbacteriaceae bacterium]
MLTRETLTRQAFDAVVTSIVDRGLKPGDALPSTSELTEQFGISRPVVREALSALQACGFVDIRNGRNPVVGKLDGRLIEMFMVRALQAQQHPMTRLMEVRAPLEIQAARLAAERADEESIGRIDASNARMAQTLHNKHEYPTHDTAFHVEIAKATNNQALIWMIASIRTELMTVMFAVRAFREANGLVGQEQDQHGEIARAIHDRNPAAAAAAMDAHLKTSLDLIQQVQNSTLMHTAALWPAPAEPAAG